MDRKSELIRKLKKEQFIARTIQKFQVVFEQGFIQFIMIEDFKEPRINHIISFLEDTKLSNNYRAKPSKIIDKNAELNLDSISGFLRSDIVLIFFSEIFCNDQQISGFIKVTKSSFNNNFNNLNNQYGFLLNEDLNRFAYFSWNKSSTKIYLYLGEIEENKFVKVLYS